MSEWPSDVDVQVLAGGDAQLIMSELVALAADRVGADRCTLTSLDQRVLRVEASYEAGGSPFNGRELPLEHLPEQPLLQEAIASRSIVTGGDLLEGAPADTGVASALAVMRHTAIVPLPLGHEVGALLILSRQSDRPFDTQELERLQEIAVPVVLALRHARLGEQGRRAQQRALETLSLMSRHVASSDEPAAFFGKMSETVAQLVGAERAAFWRIEDGVLEGQREAHGFTTAQLEKLRVPLPAGKDQGSITGLLASGKAGRYRRGESAGIAVEDALLESLEVSDMLAVPWRTAAGLLGMLSVFDSSVRFTEQDEWIMRLAARASALVWQGYEAEQRARQLQAGERLRLEAHAARMAELERQKSEFLQLASHELRTPLTLVRGYISMLQEGALGEVAPGAARVFPLIMTRLAQVNELVDRMLAASRVERELSERSSMAVPLGILVREVAGDVLPGDVAARVTVNELDCVELESDREKLRTILANLVSNALKYSPGGDAVTVTLRQEPGWAVVEVRDRGMGIPAEDIDKLFQPFRRLEAARAAGIEGTGLGLYISRTLALSLGGDIQARREDAGGCTFTLRLPMQLHEELAHA